MDDTPNLKLPYIMAAQAQKHVTHNEAIRSLDAIVQIGIVDRDLTAPPPSPADGASYIVAASATGAWAGKDHQIAAWQDGAWAFYAPREGWLVWAADEDVLLAWDGAAWTATGAGAGAFIDLSDAPASYSGAAGTLAVVSSDETGLEFSAQVPLLGINAAADATNKLAIASDASLFSHAGGGHQHKINKSADSDTASLLFQTGFSGRAEMGTTGNDDFHLKVSADGTTWIEAMVLDKDTGNVGIGVATPSQQLTLSETGALAWDESGTANVGISSLGASTLGFGNGTYGDTSGVLVAQIYATGDVSSCLINGGFQIGTTAAVKFTNDTHWFDTPDAGLSRSAAGVIAVGNGAAGNKTGVLSILRTVVSSLPSAATVGAGAFAIVTDANSPTIGSNVSGGGAIQCFVISDGTNWKAA